MREKGDRAPWKQYLSLITRTRIIVNTYVIFTLCQTLSHILILFIKTTAFCARYHYCLQFAEKGPEHKERKETCLRSHS